jgi:hypothetical protein
MITVARVLVLLPSVLFLVTGLRWRAGPTSRP